jgi:O-antigen/teichoic acid export membrane protein
VTDRSSSRARAVGVPADLRGRGTAPEPVDQGNGLPAGPRAAEGAGPSAWGLVALPPTSRLVERHLQRVRRQLSDPLTANGYALIANSGATGALGLVYWLFMARLYPTAAVGRASAIYAAMNLLAGFTAQSFNGALNRFIPQAGLRTRSFILRAYTVSTVGSVALAILFVLTAGWWGTSYSELNGPIIGTVFVCSVAAWAIFTLQDSVLVGLRAASWVLVENGLFGVVKLLLLIALVAALPFHLGIYVSWMVPAVLALPLINVLIFSHLVPRHTLLTRDFQPASNRQIGRFLAGDYSGALCMLATGSLIPVVVASSIGARQTAYFYIAWVIVGIVDMVGISMAMSLTVEGAFDAGALAANCRAALRKMTVVLLPCAVLLAVFAPVWLGLFGPAYAAQGTDVLRLLTLATVCRAPTELYLGVLRAESRTARVALVQVLRAAITLGLTVALTGVMGTLGAAVAVATTQVVALLLTAPGLWRVLRADRGRSIRTNQGLVG